MEPGRRFDPRPLIVLLAIPLVAFGESAAYYATRAVLVQYWISYLGMEMDQAYSLYGWSYAGMLAGIVVAALLGAAVGGWGTMAVGLATMAIGIALIPALGEASPVIGYLLSVAGRGMLSVAILVVIADALRGHRNWLLVACFASFYGAVNLGALTGPSVATWLLGSASLALVFGGSVSVLVVSMALTIGAGLAWLLLGRAHPEPDPRRHRATLGPHLAALLLPALGLPLLMLHYQALELSSGLAYSYVDTIAAGDTTLLSANPTVVVFVALGLFVLGLALHSLRVPARPLVVAGAGGIVVAVGVVVTLLVGWPLEASSVVPLVAGLVILAIGEVLVEVFLVAGWARDLHWRLLTPIAALWRGGAYGLSAGIAMLTTRVDPTSAPSPASWALVPSLVVVGVLLLVAGLVLARVWHPASTEPEGAQPDGSAA